jgi:hypothetical protein
MFKHNFDDPLQTIYKDIIQPLIGTFFEVDAVLGNGGTSHGQTDDNIQSAG